MRPASAIALAFLVLLAACREERGQHQGWVEADTLFVGAEDALRVTRLSVAEGDVAEPGAFLFALEASTQAAEVDSARAHVAEAEARLARLEATQQRPEEIMVLEAQQRQAEAALDFSTAELARQRDLAARNVAARAKLEEAESNYRRDLSALEAIRQQVQNARLSARREDIEAARATLAQQRAALAAAEARMRRTEVRAPAAGRIERVYYRPGEVVPAGRPVLGLLPPENIKLRFFVPQAVVPSIRVGQRVAARCDGCPDGLEATVSFIAPRAEFTPPVVFTPEERVRLVFKVEARPARPDAFRVGQPVTVTLLPEEPAR
jgi:HlyD family secretion protein